jgi:hypothetical protein
VEGVDIAKNILKGFSSQNTINNMFEKDLKKDA